MVKSVALFLIPEIFVSDVDARAGRARGPVDSGAIAPRLEAPRTIYVADTSWGCVPMVKMS